MCVNLQMSCYSLQNLFILISWLLLNWRNTPVVYTTARWAELLWQQVSFCAHSWSCLRSPHKEIISHWCHAKPERLVHIVVWSVLKPWRIFAPTTRTSMMVVILSGNTDVLKLACYCSQQYYSTSFFFFCWKWFSLLIRGMTFGVIVLEICF